MYVMYPIAYPTALLLDYFLGESHGTVYKKAGKVDTFIGVKVVQRHGFIDTIVGLKSLVSLHRAVDENGDVDALTEDEVTIIGAVLDLRAKPVSKIMTPIADCFVLSIDAVLDEGVMDLVSIDNRRFFVVLITVTDLKIILNLDCFRWLFPYPCSFPRQQVQFRRYAPRQATH
jgi:CBS domain containing-hemolysin-like protein